MDEFTLIKRWLSAFDLPRNSVILGPGDDAAAFLPSPGKIIVSTTDTLVDGVHFDSRKWPPAAIGQKALAVNLSDLAAMGARPKNALVSLCLPRSLSLSWLDRLAKGMAKAFRAANVSLLGGNISRSGELILTLTLLGEAKRRGLLTRSGACPGEIVWVSGTLGDSALGLLSMQRASGPRKRLSFLESRHCLPTPRISLGLVLSDNKSATAAIDVSDGFLSDLRHLLESSKIGAKIYLSQLPLSPAYRRTSKGLENPWTPALSGGEDYELIFTSSPKKRKSVMDASAACGVPVQPIGQTTEDNSITLIDNEGKTITPPLEGWKHF